MTGTMHICRSRVWRAAPRHLLTVTLLMPLAGLAACGSDKASSPSSSTSPAPATTVPPTTTTQPASTDPAVGPVINDLLHQWDLLMTIAYKDPKAFVEHRNEADHDILRTAFTPNSIFAAEVDDVVRSYATKGWAGHPGGSGETQRSSLVHTNRSAVPNAITFVWCSFDDSIAVIAATGEVTDTHASIIMGSGSAVRSDGRWRLDELSELSHNLVGPGTADPCPPTTGPGAASDG